MAATVSEKYTYDVNTQESGAAEASVKVVAWNTSATQQFSVSTDAQGDIAQQSVEANSHSVAAFVTTTTGRNPFKVRAVKWVGTVALVPFQITKNINAASSDTLFLTVNANITQTTKTTVDAYTGITINHTTDTITTDGTGITPIDTVDELYDRLQSEAYDSPQEDVLEVMGTVDGTNYSFNYDWVVSGHTFDGQSRSVNLATGKDLTISAAGGRVDDLAIIGDVVTGAGFNQTSFTNLDVTGDVDLTNAGAGTYSLTDCVWGSVSSTVSGIVLSLDATSSITTNNDPGNITIQTGAVTTLIKVLDGRDNSNLQNARVILRASDGTGPLPYQDSVTITRVTTTASVSHTSHGLSNGDKVEIKGANQSEYNGAKTISNVTTNAYDFTVSGSPTTPATGTITSTGLVLEGLTDVNGEISDTRSWASNQPVEGYARKATSSPIFKDGPLTGTITTSGGLSITQALVFDE